MFPTVSPPVGFLLPSLAEGNQLPLVVIHEADSVISALVKNSVDWCTPRTARCFPLQRGPATDAGHGQGSFRQLPRREPRPGTCALTPPRHGFGVKSGRSVASHPAGTCDTHTWGQSKVCFRPISQDISLCLSCVSNQWLFRSATWQKLRVRPTDNYVICILHVRVTPATCRHSGDPVKKVQP